jgi:hypothetical protein
VDPPDRLLVPIKFGKDPPPPAPLPCVPTEPPDGDSVPLSELFIATVPAEPVEKEVIKDLFIFTDEMVTDPEEEVDPLWIDLMGEVDAGKIVVAIINIPLIPSDMRLLLLLL